MSANLGLTHEPKLNADELARALDIRAINATKLPALQVPFA
jgi:hypothetical protein